MKSCETLHLESLLVLAWCWERERRALEQSSAITGAGMLSPLSLSKPVGRVAAGVFGASSAACWVNGNVSVRGGRDRYF